MKKGSLGYPVQMNTDLESGFCIGGEQDNKFKSKLIEFFGVNI